MIDTPGRILCSIHPAVDYKHAWGCPDCIVEMRAQIDPVKVKKDLAAAAKGKPTAAKPAAKQQPRKTPTKKGTTK